MMSTKIATVVLSAALLLVSGASTASARGGGECDDAGNCTSSAQTVPQPEPESAPVGPSSQGNNGSDATDSSSSNQGSNGSGNNAPSGPTYTVPESMSDYDRDAAMAAWQESDPDAFNPITGDPTGAPPCGILVVPYRYEACDEEPADEDAAPAAPQVTIEQVIAMAVAKLQLPKPDMGSAPCSGAGCKGTVGVPVWFWLEGNQWRTYSSSASAGGLTVGVVAKPTKVVWRLGDGQSVTCTSAGTPYTKGKGWASSPDCGLERGFRKAGSYTPTATITYDVTFTGDATGGTSVPLTSSTDVVVGEYQAVKSRRGTS